jgi:hypothetical protein
MHPKSEKLLRRARGQAYTALESSAIIPDDRPGSDYRRARLRLEIEFIFGAVCCGRNLPGLQLLAQMGESLRCVEALKPHPHLFAQAEQDFQTVTNTFKACVDELEGPIGILLLLDDVTMEIYDSLLLRPLDHHPLDSQPAGQMWTPPKFPTAY